MASMSKDVYKTIKRSISAKTNDIVTNGLGFGGNSTLSRLSNGNSSSNKRGKHWIHPPDALINGRVEYTAKLLGHNEVAEPRGSHVVRELDNSVTGHTAQKTKKVQLLINIDRLCVRDAKDQRILFEHPLHMISFCADDKEDKRLFSYIAKTGASMHECFVFTSEKLAEQITLTVGEAFDLALERYIRESKKDLNIQKQIIILKKRNAELEAENDKLKKVIENLTIKNSVTSSAENGDNAPVIPNTPVPPPPSVRNNLAGSNVTPIVPPPPPQNSRRAVAQQSVHSNNNNGVVGALFGLNDVFKRETDGPDVGRRLQNLQMDRMEDLFDNEFDPRAGEKKSIDDGVTRNGASSDSSSNNCAASQALSSGATVEDFEALLRRVDERLEELNNGFNGGNLEMGDIAGLGREFGDDDQQQRTPDEERPMEKI